MARAPSRRTTPSTARAAGPPTAKVGAVPCVSVVSEPSRQYFPKNTYPCQPSSRERGLGVRARGVEGVRAGLEHLVVNDQAVCHVGVVAVDVEIVELGS